MFIFIKFNRAVFAFVCHLGRFSHNALSECCDKEFGKKRNELKFLDCSWKARTGPGAVGAGARNAGLGLQGWACRAGACVGTGAVGLGLYWSRAWSCTTGTMGLGLGTGSIAGAWAGSGVGGLGL